MAIAPIVLEFLVKGVPQVQQAFKSIQDSAMRAERAQTNAAERGATARMSAAQREAKARIAGIKAAEKELDRWQRKAAKDADRVAAAQKAASERETKARIAGIKAAEKELDQWQRKAAKAAKDEERVVEAAERRKLAIRERSANMAGRYYSKQAADEKRAADKAARDNAFARERMARAVLGAGAQGVVRGLQRVGNVSMGLANTAAQLGGGFSIADSVMQEQNLRKQAATISARTLLSGAGPGSKHGNVISTEQALSKAKAVGIAQNIDPAEVLAGVDAIAKLTGNVERSLNLVPDVAKIATATGADLGTMSGLAGNIYAANEDISDKDLVKQLRIFTKQSVVGGVELEDFARHGSRITSAASMYGGSKEKNEATIGALAQISRQFGSASSASEATMGAQRFSTDVAKRSKTLKDKYNIDVTDGNGNLRDAEGIILDMVKATNGDVEKLYGLVGDRGVRPLEGAANIFKNKGRGAAGLQAVKDEFAKYNTGVTPEEIEAANKRVLEEQKFEQSMRELRIAAGEQLLPVFKDMLPALRDLIPLLVQAAKVGIPAFTELMTKAASLAKQLDWLVKGVAEHPIGALIGFEITKSFAEAALPALLSRLLTQAFTGGGAGGAGGALSKAAGGAGGVGLGAGALILGGALTSVALAYDTVSGTSKALSEGEAAGNDIAARIAKGDPKAVKELADAQAQSGGGATAAAWGDRAMRLVSALNPATAAGQFLGDAVSGAVTGQSNNERALQALKADQIVDTVMLQKATTDAIANGVRAGMQQGMQDAPAGNSGPNGAGRSQSILHR